MPLPVGHGRTLGQPRPLSGRERWLLRAALGALAALAVIVAVALATGAKSSAHGCIHLVIPGPVGAQQIDACGARARATCRGAAAPGAYTAQAAPVIERACRRAGLPVAG